MGIVKLQAFGPEGGIPDGEPISIDSKIARQSVTIDTILNDSGYDDATDDIEEINIIKFNAQVVSEVVTWMIYHQNDPPAPRIYPEYTAEGNRRETEISEWDESFLGDDQDRLFALMNAANYLHIPALLDIACTQYANMLKERNTIEELRDFLRLPYDFEDEDYKMTLKENEILQDGNA